MTRESCPARQTSFLTFGESRSIDDNVTLPAFVMLNVYAMDSSTAARPSWLSGTYDAPTSEVQYAMHKTFNGGCKRYSSATYVSAKTITDKVAIGNRRMHSESDLFSFSVSQSKKSGDIDWHRTKKAAKQHLGYHDPTW